MATIRWLCLPNDVVLKSTRGRHGQAQWTLSYWGVAVGQERAIHRLVTQTEDVWVALHGKIWPNQPAVGVLVPSTTQRIARIGSHGVEPLDSRQTAQTSMMWVGTSNTESIQLGSQSTAKMRVDWASNRPCMNMYS